MAKKEKQEETKEQTKNIITVSDAGPCKKKIEIEIPLQSVCWKNASEQIFPSR